MQSEREGQKCIAREEMHVSERVDLGCTWWERTRGAWLPSVRDAALSRRRAARVGFLVKKDTQNEIERERTGRSGGGAGPRLSSVPRRLHLSEYLSLCLFFLRTDMQVFLESRVP